MTLVGKWFGFSCDEIYDLAIADFERGDYDGAKEGFEKILAEDYGDKQSTIRLAKFYRCLCFCQLGRSSLKKGNPTRALEYFEACLDCFPDNVEFNLLAGIASRERGYRNFARKCFSHVLEIRPHNASAILWDAVLQYEEGQYQTALSRFALAKEMLGRYDDELYGSALSAHDRGENQKCVRTMAAYALCSPGVTQMTGIPVAAYAA